jgi:hypothetical protein
VNDKAIEAINRRRTKVVDAIADCLLNEDAFDDEFEKMEERSRDTAQKVYEAILSHGFKILEDK